MVHLIYHHYDLYIVTKIVFYGLPILLIDAKIVKYGFIVNKHFFGVIANWKLECNVVFPIINVIVIFVLTIIFVYWNIHM